ncbi:MAG: hypothetical protein ACJAYU_003378 [Bradymonadia bacterium]|jgi:hypothetical protein
MLIAGLITRLPKRATEPVGTYVTDTTLARYSSNLFKREKR